MMLRFGWLREERRACLIDEADDHTLNIVFIEIFLPECHSRCSC